MCIDNPLKKIGFQKKNGTSPHFIKTEDIKINQGIVRLIVSQKLLETVKYINTCSIKNQSNEYSLRYISVMKRNKFSEAINETQKKNNSDCKYVWGNTC
jgi:hypothetical protein